VGADARKFSDLTDQEKAIFISGLAELAIILPLGVILLIGHAFNLFGTYDPATSILIYMRQILPSIYLLICIPGLFVPGATYCYLRKSSIRRFLRGFLVVLGAAGAFFLLIASLLTLFQTMFSSAAPVIQLIFMVFSFLFSLVVATRVLTLKRVVLFLKNLE